MTARAAIVDAISSGALLAPALRARGIESVHVQSTDPMVEFGRASFVADDHVANVVYDGDMERCLRRLAELDVRWVLPGNETGVRLADELSERLGVPSNGTALSFARREKVPMQNAIAAAGLASIPARLARRWADVASWVEERLPVVVKPPASVATDQVFLTSTLDAARAAFDAILGATNQAGEINTDVLVQEMLFGDEYIINSVSCGGRHYITDLWRMDKVRGERPLYDRGHLLPSEGERESVITRYVHGVLDALGIAFGPAHTELMWTERGPVLIECGARLGGQQIQPTCEAVFGFSQLSVGLDAYLEPVRFAARAAEPYRRPKCVQRVELICPRAGMLLDLPRLDDVRALRSFFKLHMYVAPGRPIARTIDMSTIPGYIDLVHDDDDVVEADYRQIRSWEADSFYPLAS